jgi:histidinol-phosphatase
MSIEADLRFAHDLADAADAITLPRFRATDLRIETKPDLTPVSESDKGAEETIRRLVAASGRHEGVFGEEFGDDGEHSRRWIVDPIDGTRNYVRGVPVWATLLALEVEGELQVAVVSAPALGQRWWASRGAGTFANGELCHVSHVTRIEDAVSSTTSSSDMTDAWRKVTARTWTERGFGDFWQHCLVAQGAVDFAGERELALWDFAAVQLLVEEAGGRCTTLTGDATGHRQSFLSSNGSIHELVLAELGHG